MRKPSAEPGPGGEDQPGGEDVDSGVALSSFWLSTPMTGREGRVVSRVAGTRLLPGNEGGPRPRQKAAGHPRVRLAYKGEQMLGPGPGGGAALTKAPPFSPSPSRPFLGSQRINAKL